MRSANNYSQNIRIAVIISIINLALVLVICQFIQVPGYMDAEYYYAGGIQLVQGKGFTEPFAWNYLDGINTLPRPSHTYWMPLVSILAAAGMWLTGSEAFASARVLFLVMFALIPAIVFFISIGLKFDQKHAILAALLAMFPGFYFPYYSTTDGFVLYVLLGAIYFLIIHKQFNDHPTKRIFWFYLGVICGLMHLTRADGLIWFIGSCVIILVTTAPIIIRGRSSDGRKGIIVKIALLTSGYLIPMALWYYRNILLFSSVVSPAGSKVLWLTLYDQLFTYPPSNLSYQSWLSSGWNQILMDRIAAFGDNVMTFVAVQNNIYLVPLTILGFAKLIKRKEFQIALLYWIMTFTLMTVIYPYAGSRGGFFHSGAAFQVMIWISTAIGLESFIQYMVRKRNWEQFKAWKFFSRTLIVAGLLFTTFISYSLIFGESINKNEWSQGWEQHQEITNLLWEYEITEEGIIMINNPPGFFLVSNRPSIVIPFGDTRNAIEAAEAFNAEALVLQRDHVSGLDDLYENPRDVPGIQYLGSINDTRIFRFSRLIDD